MKLTVGWVCSVDEDEKCLHYFDRQNLLERVQLEDGKGAGCNVKMNFTKIDCEAGVWMHLFQDRAGGRDCYYRY